MIYKVPVTYTVHGFITVEAENPQDLERILDEGKEEGNPVLQFDPEVTSIQEDSWVAFPDMADLWHPFSDTDDEDEDEDEVMIHEFGGKYFLYFESGQLADGDFLTAEEAKRVGEEQGWKVVESFNL